MARHPGNVWLPILSLSREDAARLGYDDAGRWKNLLTASAMEMARAMKIPWDQFRWYAAFHDESHHPHVHMVCYSADGRSGYLTRQGIADIKSKLAGELFRGELTELYQQQTRRRDDLTRRAGQVMGELIRQMETGTLENPRIGQRMEYLAEKLKTLSGKKQYGYLKAPLKAVVDEVVDELARDPRISRAYELWYGLREEVLRTYRDDLPERLPLSRQKEFKQIRNLVIQEAVRLGSQAGVPVQSAAADLPSTAEADGGITHPAPQHVGLTPAADRTPSAPSVSCPPSSGLSAALSCSTRLLRHMADLFREQEPRLPVGTIRFTDRKLLRKLREKKIAMGHRPDDHEEEGISMR